MCPQRAKKTGETGSPPKAATAGTSQPKVAPVKPAATVKVAAAPQAKVAPSAKGTKRKFELDDFDEEEEEMRRLETGDPNYDPNDNSSRDPSPLEYSDDSDGAPYTQSWALKKPPIKKLCTAFCPNKLKNLAHSS